MTEPEATALFVTEARRVGITLTDDEAVFLLWEVTGWPSFFTNGIDDLPGQIREYLTGRLLSETKEYT